MTLSTGGSNSFPPNWGFPSSIYNFCTGQYETGGMIWWGQTPATEADIAAVQADPRYNGSIDPLTLCGRADPEWTNEREVKKRLPCYRQRVTIG